MIAFTKERKCRHFENNQDIKTVATADLQQISQSSLKIIQFKENSDAILHPPF